MAPGWSQKTSRSVRCKPMQERKISPSTFSPGCPLKRSLHEKQRLGLTKLKHPNLMLQKALLQERFALCLNGEKSGFNKKAMP